MTSGRSRKEEVAASLVMDDGLRARVVVRRVADVVAVQMRVEVLEDADVAILARLVLDRDFLEVDVAIEIDRVPASQLDPQAGVAQVRVTDEGLVLVIDPPLPALLVDPRELPVDPDAEATGVAGRVVLETDVRVVDVPQRVGAVERDEEVAVAEREIARHGLGPARRREEALCVRDDAVGVAAVEQVRTDERS